MMQDDGNRQAMVIHHIATHHRHTCHNHGSDHMCARGGDTAWCLYICSYQCMLGNEANVSSTFQTPCFTIINSYACFGNTFGIEGFTFVCWRMCQCNAWLQCPRISIPVTINTDDCYLFNRIWSWWLGIRADKCPHPVLSIASNKYPFKAMIDIQQCHGAHLGVNLHSGVISIFKMPA